ncbi:MAG TPA: nucleotide pyrophosphatase/phosphodiesterase family protein [Candidatus Paceibacterota bacterium]|jgi:predicted AlkP superfamily pyrophosphatase or phosphodiesterase
MIHHHIADEIRREKKRDTFLYPWYGKYSIAELPPSIMLAFGMPTTRPHFPFSISDGTPKKVLFFFVDGLGFDHFVEHEKTLPLFNRLAERGEVYPITSTFPATTPAALTTIHTNRTPQEHGLPEWTLYFEELGQRIESLPFRPHLTHEREALLNTGGKPEMLYDGPTFYEELGAGGVRSYTFIKKDYSGSTYNRMTQRGSIERPYASPGELAANMAKTLKEESGPAYLFAYWDRVDGVQHAFGPGSPEHRTALEELSEFILTDFVPQLTPESARDTIFLICSDHGQAPIADENIIYLDDYLYLKGSYRINPAKESILPTGSPHDVFLYIEKDKLDETYEYLKKELEGRVEVLYMDDAIKRGLFGLYEPSARFRARVGDLLLLPREGLHVWYRYVPYFGMKGMHGGLSEREMLVPLAVAELSELIR